MTPSLPDYLVPITFGEEYAALLREGQLAKAESWLDDHEGPETVEERERLRRLRHDFSDWPDTMLEKLRSFLPDAGADELEALALRGCVQSALIDGERRFFRREPHNLLKFTPELHGRGGEKARLILDPAAADTSPVKLADHAADALAHYGQGDLRCPVTFRVRHRISVAAGVIAPGETVRCWMPFPIPCPGQDNIALTSTSHPGAIVGSEDAPHRTVYQQAIAEEDAAIVFEIGYGYRSFAFVPELDPDKAAPDAADGVPDVYTEERLPHVPLEGRVRDIATRVGGGLANPLLRAKALWRWVAEEIPWAAEHEYAVLPRIVDKVLDTGRGDCGTQALLFIALCRASGIPARWQSGWVTRPGAWNLHDWAEFHVAPWGWLPADPSIGLLKADETPVREFLFGHRDAYRMIANRDFCAAFEPRKRHLRSDPIDSQRGEVETAGRNLYYDEFSYDVSVEVVE